MMPPYKNREEKNKPFFTHHFQFGGIFIFISIVAAVTAVNITGAYNNFSRQSGQMRDRYISRQKEMVKHEVLCAVKLISHEREQTVTDIKARIKSRTYEACAMAQNIHRRYGTEKGKSEIIDIILTALRPIRFENNTGHYFAIDYSGTVLLASDNPAMEGSNILNIHDSNNHYPAKDMINMIKKSEEGFYEYQWSPDVSTNNTRRMAYIKQLKPYECYIGAAVHTDEIKKQTENFVLNMISKIRFGKEGYVFVNRLNGDALVSNGKHLCGTNKLWVAYGEYSQKLKDLFENEYNAAMQPDGDFINYSFVKLTSKTEAPKVSFIYGIPELNWLVGAGVYLDDIEEDIALMQANLNRQVESEIIGISTVTLVIILGFLLLFYRINRKLKNDINQFSTFFKQSEPPEPIDLKNIQFREFDQLAKRANMMLEAKSRSNQQLICEREALRKSEAKFRGIVETTCDTIWELDKKGRYTYLSPQVKTILGYEPEELLGKTPEFLVPQENMVEFAKKFAEIFEKKKPFLSLESTVLTKTGDRIVVETNGIPLFCHNGEFRGFCGTDRNITERKHNEEKLQQMQNLKSVGLLAGGIAHDFNNILMGLYGNISLTKIELPKDHPAYKFLDEAEKSMTRAIRLTKQLLTFSKGGMPVKGEVKIDKLVHKIAAFDLSGSNVQLVFNKDDSLWTANADEGQTQQVFSNLTINAMQSMPNGGHIFITLENATVAEGENKDLIPGKYIKATVRDEGIGIDKESLSRIFDPYFTTKQSGSGLGLTTVFSIVTKHGGSIQVESSPGSGTTFTLYLPAAESEHLNINEPAAAGPVKFSKNHKILVMDDEKTICTLVKRVLNNAGLYVETAHEGKEAVEMYKQAISNDKAFDLVIMDLTIPGGIGGKEAIKSILELNPDAKVIASSGYANDPVMANFTDYGFCGTIAKPYTGKQLIETLNRILG